MSDYTPRRDYNVCLSVFLMYVNNPTITSDGFNKLPIANHIGSTQWSGDLCCQKVAVYLPWL